MIETSFSCDECKEALPEKKSREYVHPVYGTLLVCAQCKSKITEGKIIPGYWEEAIRSDRLRNIGDEFGISLVSEVYKEMYGGSQETGSEGKESIVIGENGTGYRSDDLPRWLRSRRARSRRKQCRDSRRGWRALPVTGELD